MFKKFLNLFSKKKITEKRKIGNWAEGLAAGVLLGKKLKILEKNWVHGHDELDIIAEDNGQIVFVEVRATHKKATVPGYFTIQKRKKTALRRAIRSYLWKHPDSPWRFDVIEISYNTAKDYELNHYEGVRL